MSASAALAVVPPPPPPPVAFVAPTPAEFERQRRDELFTRPLREGEAVARDPRRQGQVAGRGDALAFERPEARQQARGTVVQFRRDERERPESGAFALGFSAAFMAQLIGQATEPPPARAAADLSSGLYDTAASAYEATMARTDAFLAQPHLAAEM